MIEATLCFLLRKDEILLAKKKYGFGVGKWNGVGGKVEEGETFEEAIIRESQEEIFVDLKKIKKVAILNFYFDENPEWNMRGHIYTCEEWENEPKESEEMRPKWFSRDNIPFHEMWCDDHLWLPDVLKGKKIQADFYFETQEIIRDHSIKEVLEF